MNNKGFGLVEVLCISLIGTITIFALSRMVHSSLKFTRHVQSKSDFTGLVDELRLILGDSNACATALVNGNLPPTRAQFNPRIVLATNDQLNSLQIAGTAFVQAGQSFPTFRISNLSLIEVDSNLRAETASQIKYLAKLQVAAQKTGTWMQGQTVSQEFLLWLIVSKANNEILSCSSYTPITGNGTQYSGAQVVYFSESGTFKTKLSAGSYYITAIGAGGGAGGAQAGGGTSDGGGGGGGGYAFSRCVFDVPVVLDITVGKKGSGNHWGVGGLAGGNSTVSLSGVTQVEAEGGHGGTPFAGTPIASQNGDGGQGLNISTANCTLIAAATGGDGGTRAGISGAGGGGAGNGGTGGARAPGGLGGNGGNGQVVSDALASTYSMQGGDGGEGGCDSTYHKGGPYQAGIQGSSPGGGGGASCNGHRGADGADGRVMIYPE